MDRNLKTQSAALIMYQTFGVWPEVEQTPDYDRLYYKDPEARRTAENVVIRFLEQENESDLKIDLWPIARGAVVRKYGQYALAAGAAIMTLKWMNKR